MFDGGKFNLELGFWGYSMFTEYLEYEINTVPYFDLEFSFFEELFDVEELCRFEDITNHQ